MEEKAHKTKVKRRNLPQKDADLITVAHNAAAAWEKNPDMKLIWIKLPQFKQHIEAFETSFLAKNDNKGSRNVVSQTLKTINAEINTHIEYIKTYLIDLYSKKEAPAYYAQFGIVKQKSGYKLPSDNDKRLAALEQLLKGIAQNNLQNKKYGEAYWTDILVRFKAAKADASTQDGVSSGHVNIKNEQKAIIQHTLNALIFLIKANHYKTWKDELRVWGFQKEKY